MKKNKIIKIKVIIKLLCIFYRGMNKAKKI